MSDALYERYKDALRRGHVAAQQGRFDVALDAYGAASHLAPDRAMPLVSIAGVLVRLDRNADALAAYDAALDRAPGDEAALRGRSVLLTEAGDRIGAAASLDRLAVALEAEGRIADATDAASRALELAESRERRVTVRQLAERLRALPADPAASDILATAMRLLDGPPVAARAPGSNGVGPDATDAHVESITDRPEPAPPFLAGEATDAVERAAAAGDAEATRAVALAASAGHRAAGSAAAAIDACYIALSVAPADPDLHLALADLYLDRGWRALAVDKLSLLARLADLAADAATRDRICEIAAARLPGEERLTTLCA
jgi:tetratricopeptide (TPR) repeat protein